MNSDEYIYKNNAQNGKNDLNLLFIEEKKSRNEPLTEFENFIEVYSLYKLGKYNSAYNRVEELINNKKSNKSLKLLKYQILLKMGEYKTIIETPSYEQDFNIIQMKASVLSDRSKIIKFNPVPALDISKFFGEQDENFIYIKIMHRVFAFQVTIDFFPDMISIIIDSDDKKDFFKKRINLYNKIKPEFSDYTVEEECIKMKCQKAKPKSWANIFRYNSEEEERHEFVEFPPSANMIKNEKEFEKFLNEAEEDFKKYIQSFENMEKTPN